MYNLSVRFVVSLGFILGLFGSWFWKISLVPVLAIVFLITILEIGKRKMWVLLLGIFLGGIPMWGLGILGTYIFSGGLDEDTLLRYLRTLFLVPGASGIVILLGVLCSWIGKMPFSFSLKKEKNIKKVVDASD